MLEPLQGRGRIVTTSPELLDGVYLGLYSEQAASFAGEGIIVDKKRNWAFLPLDDGTLEPSRLYGKILRFLEMAESTRTTLVIGDFTSGGTGVVDVFPPQEVGALLAQSRGEFGFAPKVAGLPIYLLMRYLKKWPTAA